MKKHDNRSVGIARVDEMDSKALPGIVAGGMLVFIPAAGELVIPTLVGDAASPMIGRVISDQFSSARDWPMASSIAVVQARPFLPFMFIAQEPQMPSRQSWSKWIGSRFSVISRSLTMSSISRNDASSGMSLAS